MYKAVDPTFMNIFLPLQEAIAVTGRHGFDGMMIDPRQIESAGPDAVNGWLDDANLINAGYNVILPIKLDGKELENYISVCARHAALARRTGCVRASGWLQYQTDLSFEETFLQYKRRLRPLARVLADEGIALGIEFIGIRNPYDGIVFVDNMGDCLRFCKALDADNCGVLIDTYHLQVSGDMDDVLRLNANEVANIHICDDWPEDQVASSPRNSRLLPGESGVIDCRRFLRNLKRIGYEGPIIPEPFYEPFKTMADPDRILSMTMESMIKVWPG